MVVGPLRQWLDPVFYQHPRENQMTYIEHLRRSWGFAWAFFRLGSKAVVHGVLPCWFQTSSTDGIFNELPRLHHETLQESGLLQQPDDPDSTSPVDRPDALLGIQPNCFDPL